MRTWWSRVAPAPADGLDPVDVLCDEGADPERRVLSDDLSQRAAREIRRLSPKLRDTLLLAATGEHTYEEISAMLGIPAGTVKWRVSEARRVVSARLEGRVEIRRTDAADVGGDRGSEHGALRLQRDRGGLARDLGDVGLAARLEHLGGDSGDGQRRVLHVLFTELCRNDHLFQDLFLGCTGCHADAREQ